MIDPFVPLHVVGFDELYEPITGNGFITTVVFAEADVQPFTVAVTEYVPAAAVVAAVNVVFCVFAV